MKFGVLRTTATIAWCIALLCAMIWAHSYERNVVPPTRAEFEERHRICYDIYAASSADHAYDLLAATFRGEELDREFCLYAQAARQLNQATATVTVWDLAYQDFKVLEVNGARCKVYSKWTVTYVLGHSQHSHVRSNAYEAVFEMSKDAEGWRIESSRIVSEDSHA